MNIERSERLIRDAESGDMSAAAELVRYIRRSGMDLNEREREALRRIALTDFYITPKVSTRGIAALLFRDAKNRRDRSDMVFYYVMAAGPVSFSGSPEAWGLFGGDFPLRQFDRQRAFRGTGMDVGHFGTELELQAGVTPDQPQPTPMVYGEMQTSPHSTTRAFDIRERGMLSFAQVAADPYFRALVESVRAAREEGEP